MDSKRQRERESFAWQLFGFGKEKANKLNLTRELTKERPKESDEERVVKENDRRETLGNTQYI